MKEFYVGFVVFFLVELFSTAFYSILQCGFDDMLHLRSTQHQPTVMCGGRYCCFIAVATAWAAFEKTNLARATSDHHPLPGPLFPELESQTLNK